MPTTSTLTSLAILKVNWDSLQRDYLDNFLPLVIECVRLAPSDTVSLPDIQEALKARFGLALPLNPVRTLLKRAAKRGYLRRESQIYVRDGAKCASHNFEATKTKVEGLHDQVVAALTSFAAGRGTTWSSEDAEAALLGFLADHSLALLYAKVEGTIVPSPSIPENGDFLVGAFIQNCQMGDPGLFAKVETLAKGHLLATALYLPDPGALAQRFDRTKVYLDTSLLVYAAGYAGSHREAPVRELLSLLQDYGASVCCFEETVEEVRGVLDACAHRLRRGQLRDAYGPTIEYLIETGRTASDVELMGARLSHKLGSLGIRIESKPVYNKQYQVDEVGFEAAIQNEIHYANPKARVHDVDCVSAIARVRQGHHSYAVETSRAVFVTPNVALARTARAFFQPDSPPGAISLCITDHALASMLWLKNPTKAPDLPTKALIADAFAAVQPPDGLWKMYLTEIARLQDQGDITPDAYYVLRHAQAAKAALMDITHGDPEAFSEGTVQEILAVAQANLTAGLRNELQMEARRRADAEAELADARFREAHRARQIAAIARAIARVVSRVVFGVLVLVLGVGTLYSFPWNLPELRVGWWRYFLAAVQAALFLFTLMSITYGTTAQSSSQRIQGAIEGRLSAFLGRHLLEVDSTPLPPPSPPTQR